MKQKMNTYLLGASMVALTFSFSFSTDAISAETCATVPSCAELGYTDTWCDFEGGAHALKCPFDQTKLHCSYVTTDCESGSIVYSDRTCSYARNPNKTPIGVIYKNNSILHVVALNDQSSGTKYTNVASICRNYRIGGLSGWHYGEVMGSGYTFFTGISYIGSHVVNRVNSGLARAGGTPLSGSYWTHAVNSSHDSSVTIYTRDFSSLNSTSYTAQNAANLSKKVRCMALFDQLQ